MRRRGLAKSIGLIVVALFAIAAIGYVLLQPAIGWPDENRRVVHPAGFSVVAPKAWEQHLDFGNGEAGKTDALRFLPTNAVGNPGVFSVSRLATPPVEAELRHQNFAPVTFVGRPAWQSTKESSKLYSHARNLIFERGDAWYDLVLVRPMGETLDTGVWQAYLESFRLEKPRATAASLPTLSLAATTRPAP